MTGPAPETDIVALLLQDHAAIEELLTGYDGLTEGQKRERFGQLVQTLVRHETGEERIVYPAVRLDVLPGDEIARALLEQESEISLLLATAEKLAEDSSSFLEVLAGIEERLRGHMSSEELNLLPLLRNLEDDERRWELGDRYLRAVRSAPTHPHPHVPTSRAGMAVAEPIASLIDHTRDLVNRQVG